MTSARVVAWQRSDEQRGHSVARVAPAPGGWTCHGTEVLGGPDVVLACTFRVDLDAGWRTTHVDAAVVDATGERRLVLTAEGGRWTRNGVPAPELDGCTDVDVAATPLTNTFPIRRLAHLGTGERQTLAVAWIDVPSLAVTRVEQTYTRLAERRWRYEDDDHGAFELTVDDDGIVVDYEGFATRVAP